MDSLRIMLFGMALYAVVILIAWMVVAPPARSHFAPAGTQFPIECCTETDCEPVTREQIQVEPNGDWYVKLQRGTVHVPADFPRTFFSEPGLFVCAGQTIRGLHLRCVLVQPGV